MPEKLLTPEQIQTIKSMNEYWEEVYRREDNRGILTYEVQSVVLSVIPPETMLKIIAQYALKQE